MSDRIAWFISGACLSALLLTTTGFKTVPDGPGALGAADSFVTVMSDVFEERYEERLLYTVPDGFVLSLTDWRSTHFDFYATYTDSTVRKLNDCFPASVTQILRTGVALPAGTELSAISTSSTPRRFGFTGQLYRE